MPVGQTERFTTKHATCRMDHLLGRQKVALVAKTAARLRTSSRRSSACRSGGRWSASAWRSSRPSPCYPPLDRAQSSLW